MVHYLREVFYIGGLKMNPCTRVGDDVPRTRVDAFNPVFCDYALYVVLG